MTAPIANNGPVQTSNVPVQAKHEETLLESMKACGQSVVSMVKPVHDIFSNMVSDICNKPFYDAKVPENASTEVKVAHHVRETFIVLAKLTLIASGLYIATLSFTVLKVVLITALTILGLSYVARNEKIINKISETVSGIIAKLPAKAPAVPVEVKAGAAHADETNADAAKVEATKVEVKTVAQKPSFFESVFGDKSVFGHGGLPMSDSPIGKLNQKTEVAKV